MIDRLMDVISTTAAPPPFPRHHHRDGSSSEATRSRTTHFVVRCVLMMCLPIAAVAPSVSRGSLSSSPVTFRGGRSVTALLFGRCPSSRTTAAVHVALSWGGATPATAAVARRGTLSVTVVGGGRDRDDLASRGGGVGVARLHRPPPLAFVPPGRGGRRPRRRGTTHFSGIGGGGPVYQEPPSGGEERPQNGDAEGIGSGRGRHPVRSSLRRSGLGAIVASAAGIGGSALESGGSTTAGGGGGLGFFFSRHVFAAARRVSSSSSSSPSDPPESEPSAVGGGTHDDETRPQNPDRRGATAAPGCTNCVDCCHREEDGGRPVPVTRISYMTDVEGDGEYFDRFVELSSVLGFRDLPVDDAGSSESAGVETGTEEQHRQGGAGRGGDPYVSLPNRREVVFLDNSVVSVSANGNDRDVGYNVTKTAFVYGGDVWDKGGSDLYVLGQLVSLGERYGPDKVHFVMGNRDINKMRISQELGSGGPGPPKRATGTAATSAEQATLPRHGGVYWLRGTGIMGDPELEDDEDNGDIGNCVPDTAPERLRWMLKMTMGSPDAFEFRRGDLGRIASASASDDEESSVIAAISDDDVVRSYREACGPPDGLMARYLGHAVLVRRIGSVLFLHGALPLPPASWGAGDFGYAMPWLYEDERRRNRDHGTIRHPDEWIEALNDFARDQVRSWRNLDQEKLVSGGVWSSEGGYHNRTAGGVGGGGSLMQYGMGWTPDRKQNPTVVYSSWLTDAMPAEFVAGDDNDLNDSSKDQPNTVAQLLCDFLDEAGLQLVVTGHKPHGDLPLPIRLPTGSNANATCGGTSGAPRWIVTGDTSYSGDTRWVDGTRSNLGRGSSSSGRGDVAVSEIVIDQCSTCERIIRVQSAGVMSDGSTYRSTNLMDETESSHVGRAVDGDLFVVEGKDSPELPPLGGGDDDGGGEGQRRRRLWWAKTKLEDGSYVVSTAKGFDVWNTIARKR